MVKTRGMNGLALLGLLAVLSLSTQASLQEGWASAGWLKSHTTALKQAKRQHKPVLLYFDASWCSWCQLYKRNVLDRPDVKTVLKKSFIAVVIDYDARPDLFHHYNGIGLPYTVILNSNGKVINRFSGILAEKDFLDTLRESLRLTARHELTVFMPTEPVRISNTGLEDYRAFQKAFLEHIDSLYSPGQFTLAGQYETGATLKRPSPRTWMYLMQHGLWPERVHGAIRRERARLTDEIDGGYFNYFDSNRLDEDYLESSKLLEVNAWMSAWQALAVKQNVMKHIAVEPGWYFLRTVLWDEKQGGFWQAQAANNAYYEAPMTLRPKLVPPPVDRLKRADTNAQAAIALFQSGRNLGNRELQRYARQTLVFILDHMISNNSLYHVYSPSGLSVKALPQDLFWVLLAGQEIHDLYRHQGMLTVRRQAIQWLSDQMKRNQSDNLPVELIGLVAQTVCNKQYAQGFPKSACEWAIIHLRIEATSPPDSLVPGLLAWETLLGNPKYPALQFK